MQAPKRRSIEAEGLQQYLDRTKEDHNSLGYDNFVQMVTDGIDKANLSRAFGVGRTIIYKWLSVYMKESQNG